MLIVSFELNAFFCLCTGAPVSWLLKILFCSMTISIHTWALDPGSYFGLWKQDPRPFLLRGTVIPSHAQCPLYLCRWYISATFYWGQMNTPGELLHCTSFGCFMSKEAYYILSAEMWDKTIPTFISWGYSLSLQLSSNTSFKPMIFASHFSSSLPLLLEELDLICWNIFYLECLQTWTIINYQGDHHNS